jgi:hypothetical protein
MQLQAPVRPSTCLPEFIFLCQMGAMIDGVDIDRTSLNHWYCWHWKEHMHSDIQPRVINAKAHKAVTLRARTYLVYPLPASRASLHPTTKLKFFASTALRNPSSLLYLNLPHGRKRCEQGHSAFQ